MGIWVNEETPTMSFVLYTNNVECMCYAIYVTWKYRQYRRYHVIFARKYRTFQKINILGTRFNSSGTLLFTKKIQSFELEFIDFCSPGILVPYYVDMLNQIKFMNNSFFINAVSKLF